MSTRSKSKDDTPMTFELAEALLGNSLRDLPVEDLGIQFHRARQRLRKIQRLLPEPTTHLGPVGVWTGKRSRAADQLAKAVQAFRNVPELGQALTLRATKEYGDLVEAWEEYERSRGGGRKAVVGKAGDQGE